MTQIEAFQSTKGSAGLSAALPGAEGTKSEIQIGGENNVKSTTGLSARFERFGVDIRPGILKIFSESELAGNAVAGPPVPVTLKTDPQTIWKEFPADKCDPKAATPRLSIKDTCHHGPLAKTEDQDVSDSRDPTDRDEDLVLLVTGVHAGDEPPPGDVKPAIEMLPQVVVPHCPLLARVWMLYEARIVEHDSRKYKDEGQQAVTLERGAQDKADVEIMSADEVSPAVWSLRICDTSQCNAEPLKLLQAKLKGRESERLTPNGVMRKVVFTDYGKAAIVAQWLQSAQQKSPDRSNYTFNYPSPVPGSKQALIPFKNTRDECR